MPSIMNTGFVSKEQEEYLRLHEPDLYKAVLKKHGTFGKPKKALNTMSVPTNKRHRG